MALQYWDGSAALKMSKYDSVYFIYFCKTELIQRTYVETSGKRQCNCRTEMKQKRMGHGQFSIYQERVCDECPNVKLVSSDEELEIEIEKGILTYSLFKRTPKGSDIYIGHEYTPISGRLNQLQFIIIILQNFEHI